MNMKHDEKFDSFMMNFDVDGVEIVYKDKNISIDVAKTIYCFGVYGVEIQIYCKDTSEKIGYIIRDCVDKVTEFNQWIKQ